MMMHGLADPKFKYLSLKFRCNSIGLNNTSLFHMYCFFADNTLIKPVYSYIYCGKVNYNNQINLKKKQTFISSVKKYGFTVQKVRCRAH